MFEVDFASRVVSQCTDEQYYWASTWVSALHALFVKAFDFVMFSFYMYLNLVTHRFYRYT